jgi:hypothetical protein
VDLLVAVRRLGDAVVARVTIDHRCVTVREASPGKNTGTILLFPGGSICFLFGSVRDNGTQTGPPPADA